MAQWLTSGLRVAMARTGWHLLSPRLMLTKVPGGVLSDYYHNGYPFTPKMADRPYNQYGTQLYTKERWDQLCAWLTGNPNFRLQLVDHKQALRDQPPSPLTWIILTNLEDCLKGHSAAQALNSSAYRVTSTISGRVPVRIVKALWRSTSCAQRSQPSPLPHLPTVSL